ncbi:MAG: 23S rRNA (pseudouridine(1915)-N(3))-methyltransferase RlmH [Ruminococcaceae bacterium]|nr:23S rRNA (pseudouridine(1915)-N(3))-methyltransferase RlmH [Oscillospiraceae bacterium]
MLNIKIICCGTLKESYLRDAVKEYEKRLSAFCKLTIQEIKEDSLSAAYSAVSSFKGYKIALCIEGNMISSEQLAEKIDTLTTNGTSEIAFIIGGSDGIAENIKNMCNYRLSFSKMTFPHQLMRVILLEQTYRAFTIINHKQYHK